MNNNRRSQQLNDTSVPSFNTSFLKSQNNPFHSTPAYKNPVQANSTWVTPPGMTGQMMNPQTQTAMQQEYNKNFFNYFMFELQTAPISSGIKGVKNSPLVSYIYKWDFWKKVQVFKRE